MFVYLFVFWKQLSVIPLNMKGAKVKVENYRPVSLASDELSVNLRGDWKEVEAFGFMEERSCLPKLLDTSPQRALNHALARAI